MNRSVPGALVLGLFWVAGAARAQEPTWDLTGAVVIAPAAASPVERQAATMLIDEVARRTGIRWELRADWPAAAPVAVVVGPVSGLAGLAGRFRQALAGDAAAVGEEGYRLRGLRDDAGTAVFVLGDDPRGTMFGVGRLLRDLHLVQGRATLPADYERASAPTYALRGHQLGYRPKTNSYDAWDLPVWEQYYRDLIVFGTNAVELVPPRTDDDPQSPHFPRPPLEMMVGMSRLADQYGLDVWIWFPAMDPDYAREETVQASLAEWRKVFEALPRIDAVFVPGGDPGHTQPNVLLALLERQARQLRELHPEAEMWVSPQGFNAAWMDEFLATLKTRQPEWLTGVVFGPQVRLSLAELRFALPARYPIRHYPDITHSRQCQYPVPDWDAAHALTSSRECINPRPLGQATIFQLLQPMTVGFLTYSEGCNDDVNKFVWSGLGWAPETPVIEILRDYADYFVGERYRDELAQGLLALERNWQGLLIANGGVETTLEQFQALERQATPGELANWRLQQPLYRAYYDAYVRERLIYETDLETQALARLRRAGADDALAALDEAEALLDRAETAPVAVDLRLRVGELAQALFDSIRMQTSVKLYQAIDFDRGATLDTVDFPLNDRHWLKQQFAALRHEADPLRRLTGLRRLVDWTNPGPGGFYDDLGRVGRQPHLVVGPGFERDPAFLVSSHGGFAGPESLGQAQQMAWRRSWIDHAEAMLEAPLRMRYEDLDPGAQYTLRVVYAGDGPQKKIRLDAQTTQGTIEIHPLITKPAPIAPLDLAIPPAAYAEGTLELNWHRQDGLGDNGRGCQVSEVWLIRGPGEAAR